MNLADIPSLIISIPSISIIGLITLIILLDRALNNAPKLINYSDLNNIKRNTSLTIIIPTYNEERNIQKCLTSITESLEPCKEWEVIMVDDNSTDKTISIGRKTTEKSRLSIDFLNAGTRPINERWVGKNWPCSIGTKEVNSEWILFLDADIELKKETLFRAISQSINEDIDLLSLAPRLTCNCLAEWMVQPIMASLISIGFPIKETNKEKSSTAFAAGPFMLFRRTAYEAIGGHRNIAGEVVEDLALAKKIKNSGYKLSFLLGLDALDLNMYSDFASLWEGWTKNWFLGLDRNILKASSASLIVFCIFSIPWLTLIFTSFYLLIIRSSDLFLTSFVISSIGIFLQLILRIWINKKFEFPVKNWWLMGAGGIIILFLGPVSIWRTITGKGWTWKGRSLA